MTAAFGSRAQGARLERIKASPRYGDGVFRNTGGISQPLKRGQGMATVKEYFFGGQRRVPPAPLPSTSPLAAWPRAPETGLRATWLGHSTVLLEIDGCRVLTDPVWGPRTSPYSFAGPKRFQPVPIEIDSLPKLDAVVISHDHYDHLDYPSVLALAKRDDVTFYTSLGVGAHLAGWGVPEQRIVELDWWSSAHVRGLEITFAPSQHFSGRGPAGRNLTLWSSIALRTEKHRVFFSGDTGLTPEYAEIGTRLGPFDLVMLEVGAFHPAWGDIHLGPHNALAALASLGGGAFLPVHWGTFNLAMHAWDEPAETLLLEAPKRDVHLVMPLLGDAVEPSRAAPATPWWRAVGTEPGPLEDDYAHHDLDEPIEAGPPPEPTD